MAEFIHPTGPCADCGKQIANSHWYYAGGRDGRKEGYYHSTCGDPFGIKAAVAAERERCAKIAENSADQYDRLAVDHYKQSGEGRFKAASDAASEIAEIIRGNGTCG